VERSPLVYLDPNLLMRAYEDRPEEAANPSSVFGLLRHNKNLAVTSELTPADLLAPGGQRDGQPARPSKKECYLDLPLGYRFIDLGPVAIKILIATAELRESFPTKRPDAIHMVTAIETRCAYFSSRDHGTERLLKGLIHLLADEAGIHTLIEALHAGRSASSGPVTWTCSIVAAIGPRVGLYRRGAW